MTPHPIDPTRDLSQKFHKLTFLLDRIADQTLADGPGLTFGQYRLLMALHHRRALSQKKVAQFHGLTEAAVSRTIDVLVKRKFIVRQSNPTNRREHLILLTPSGERHALKAHKILTARFAKLYEVLSPSERDALLSLLQKLLGGIWEEGKKVMCGLRPRTS